MPYLSAVSLSLGRVHFFYKPCMRHNLTGRTYHSFGSPQSIHALLLHSFPKISSVDVVAIHFERHPVGYDTKQCIVSEHRFRCHSTLSIWSLRDLVLTSLDCESTLGQTETSSKKILVLASLVVSSPAYLQWRHAPFWTDYSSL